MISGPNPLTLHPPQYLLRRTGGPLPAWAGRGSDSLLVRVSSYAPGELSQRRLLEFGPPSPWPSPQGEGTAIKRLHFADDRPNERRLTTFQKTANDSPSPRGEGRGEGER